MTGFSLPKYAFWDVSSDKLDVLKNKEFIISRMFERGMYEDVLSTVVFLRKRGDRESATKQ
jgi:hypothetical protein